jgi:hypothetical protein
MTASSGGPRRPQLLVAGSMTVLAAAVIIPLVVLSHHRYTHPTLVVTSFFAYGAAAAWLGLFVAQPAAASWAGVLAAAWFSAALYAATRSLTVMGWVVLAVELACISGGQPGIEIARRWLRGRPPDGPRTVLLAAVIIPFWALWNLRLVPALGLAAARGVLAALARHPWTGVLAGGVIAAFIWATPTLRLIVLGGCLAGGMVALAARAGRKTADHPRVTGDGAPAQRPQD